jgi:hypothetical protein
LTRAAAGVQSQFLLATAIPISAAFLVSLGVAPAFSKSCNPLKTQGNMVALTGIEPVFKVSRLGRGKIPSERRNIPT